MSKELEVGKYEFYPDDFENEKKIPQEVSEDLEKLLEKVRKEDENVDGEFVKSKKQKAKKQIK